MNAIFVMNSPFPYGAAFSSRARNLTKLVCNCGYHVHVIAPTSIGKENSDELLGFDYSLEYIYDPKNILSLSGIGTARPYMKAVYKYLKNNKIDLIMSSSILFVADYLNSLAKEINVPYIIEQCEWYDSSTFKCGKWNPYYREHILRITKKNMKIDGIIAISRLFEQHYTYFGVPTIRIPTILDVENTKYWLEMNKSKEYRIVFAGSLGKGKEKLESIFQALEKINKTKKKVIFDIYGPSKEAIMSNINNDSKLWKSVQAFVNIYGYISQNEVEDVIRRADFTIFTRPIRKSSDAGFPTKFAESMAVGTPVITNDTGDISLYLKNGKNGFLLKDGSSDSIFHVFEKLTSCEKYEFMFMRKNARKTAEQYFAFDKYIKSFKDFIDDFSKVNC